MEKITPLTATSNTLDTVAKLVRVMEKTGVTYEQFVLPINNRTARNNLAGYLRAGCPKMSAVTAETDSQLTGYELAKGILGKDFISPEEIAQSRNLSYTEEQLARFYDTLPAQETLEWCRNNDMMFVAGPPKSMSLLDVRTIKTDYFYSKEGGWYAKEAEKFAWNDKVDPVWIALRKSPVDGSFNKNWSEQSELIAVPTVVPNAAEAAWCLTTYKAVRGVYLLPNVYVRTSSVDSDGHRVYVGSFDASGLSVYSSWAYNRYDGLGVASARKF